MTMHAGTWPSITSRLVIVAILAASAVVVPQLTGSERVAGLIGSALVAATAAMYAHRQRELVGQGWVWFSLAIAILWLVGLGVLLFAPLPPGGATTT